MDLVTPPKMVEMRINHKNGRIEFGDNSIEELTCVPLGIIKHRVFWPPRNFGDSPTSPLCKSNDGDVGIPSRMPDNPVLKLQGFTEWEAVACEGCIFRSDGRRNARDRDEMKCTPEWTMLIYGGDAHPNMVYTLRLRGSTLWKMSQFFKPYDKGNIPAFANRIVLSLKLIERNSIEYADTKVIQGKPTDRSKWMGYLNLYTQVRDILSVPPTASGGASTGKNKMTPLQM